MKDFVINGSKTVPTTGSSQPDIHFTLLNPRSGGLTRIRKKAVGNSQLWRPSPLRQQSRLEGLDWLNMNCNLLSPRSGVNQRGVKRDNSLDFK